MHNVTIEKNIPLDPSITGTFRRHTKPVWPWLEMEPGDSFLVPDKKTAINAWASFQHRSKAKGSPIKDSWAVCMRKQPDGSIRLFLMDKDATP